MNDRQIIIFVVVCMAILTCYRIYTRPKVSAVTTVSALPDPNLFMPALATEAVAFGAALGMSLDYTEASVKSVEVLLGQLHDQREKGQLSDREVNQKAMDFGAYIGEVIRRKHGGSWARDHAVGGEESFPISWDGHDTFTVRWCGKRILNGSEDNVWFKFQVVTSPDCLPGPANSGVINSPATSR